MVRRPDADRFVVIERIGVGVIGEAHKVFDRVNHVTLAAKTISAPASTNAIEQLERHRAFDHLHLLKIVEILSADDKLVVYFEYCGLGSLGRLRQFMTSDLLLGVIRDVSEALAHLHKNNVIHGNVCPTNILINTAGVVKLAELAIVRGDDGLPAAQKWYIAPEVLAGGSLSPAADMYSLGTAAFEAAHGEVWAQQDANIKEWFVRHQTRFASGLDGWSMRLRAVICALLEPDPHRRASAEEILAMETVQSLPPTWLMAMEIIQPEANLYWD